MVDVNRGAAGYHLEAMPDGQQVLVNDRTGNVAITDPYSGQITGEMPKAQAVAQHQPGAAGGGGSVITPKTVIPPAPAGAAPPPAAGGGAIIPPAPTGGAGPRAITPRAAAQTSGNVVPRGAPAQPDPNQIPGPPGSDVYDWWTVNRALQASGLNGWQIAGDSHRPANTAEVKQVKNPAYVSEDITPDQEPFLLQANQNPTYKIGLWNPATDQRLTVTLGQQKNPDGSYQWSVLGTENQAKIDKAQPGYSSPQQMGPFADGHVELWGTNTATGAFEKMPNTPEGLGKKPGWNDIKQIDDGQGHLIWVGTDPDGRPMQPVPGAPQPVATARYVPGSVKQVTKKGKLVYVGQNAQTQGWEDIPELGSEVVAPKTTTVGHNVYTVDANGQLVLATAIAQPKENDEQWIDAGGGYAKKQVFHNGDWHDDPTAEQKAVRPDIVRAAGALKPKGEKYWIPLPGSPDKLVQVTADGNGGYTYELGPNGEPPAVKQVPGIKEPTEVTGGGTNEFYPQRRDPVTGNLLPPERNPNWSPTNVGDRVRQLQNSATQKQQELHAQVVGGTLSEDQADQQFNDWWKTTIEPAKQEIQLAQQWKVQEQQRLQEEQQRSNLATAQSAGSEAVRAVAGEHRVGPGFGNLMGNLVSAGAAGKFPTAPSQQDMQNAFVTPMPNYNDIYEQATARALAHISPTAAQLATGSPTPSLLPQLQNVDVTAGLNPTSYRFGGGPPAPQPAAAQPAIAQPAIAQPPAPIPMIAQPNAVAGQNYGAATAYPSGILPWNYMAGPYQPAF